MIKIIGIRREDKNEWERRVPLVPGDIRKLLKANPEVKVVIQPSKIRIFPDNDYVKSGAVVNENLDACDLILGIKEIPEARLQKGKMYVFFSHTVKGQKKNMEMLRRLVELKCSLMDYERIVDRKNRRLVFFGRYAGLAGMIDTFWAMGQKHLSSPFKDFKMAYQYKNLKDAITRIKSIGVKFSKGIGSLHPVVVGFAGHGNVSQGAQEIFDVLPHEVLTPEELLKGKAETISPKKLVKVVFYEKDTIEPKDSKKTFDLADYFHHPENYQSKFGQYVDRLSILVNCIFWTSKNPRLITKAQAKEIWKKGKTPKLQIIGDISCDIEGGIEFTLNPTKPDNPLFTYDPISDKVTNGIHDFGPVVMATDNLPCELPAEASSDFSKTLFPLVDLLLKVDTKAEFGDASLPPELESATYLWRGKFTPKYKFMADFLS